MAVGVQARTGRVGPRRSSAASITPAQFVGSDAGASSGSTATRTLSIARAKAGDLAIILTDFDATSAGSTLSTSGWIKVFTNWNYYATLHWKVLTPADISTDTITVSNTQSQATTTLLVYRGPTNLILRQIVGGTTYVGPTLTLPGFTPTMSARRLVALATDRDTDTTPALPSPWTQRAFVGGSGSFVTLAYDLDPRQYRAGANIVVNGLQGGSDYWQHGYVLELV